MAILSLYTSLSLVCISNRNQRCLRKKLSSQRLQRLFPILHKKGSFYSRTAIRSKQTIMLTFNKTICFVFHRLHLMKMGRSA